MTGLMHETDFMVDFSGDEPEHQVRLTLNADDVAEFRRACYDAGNYMRHHVFNILDATLYEAMAEFMSRVEKQLKSPSLAGMDEWKATT